MFSHANQERYERIVAQNIKNYDAILARFKALFKFFELLKPTGEQKENFEDEQLGKISRALYVLLNEASLKINRELQALIFHVRTPMRISSFLKDCLDEYHDDAKKHPNDFVKLLENYRNIFLDNFFKSASAENIFDFEFKVLQFVIEKMINILGLATKRMIEDPVMRELHPEMVSVLTRARDSRVARFTLDKCHLPNQFQPKKVDQQNKIRKLSDEDFEKVFETAKGGFNLRC